MHCSTTAMGLMWHHYHIQLCRDSDMIIKNKYFFFLLTYFLSNCIFLSKIYAEDAFSAAIQAFGQETYVSNNDMLYLSLNNCNALTEVCLNDTCINVCKAEDLSGV